MDGKQAISLRWQRNERPSSHAMRPRRGRTHSAVGPLPARLGPLDGTRFLFIEFVLFKTASMRGCRDAGVRSRALRAAGQRAAQTSWKQRPPGAAPPSRSMPWTAAPPCVASCDADRRNRFPPFRGRPAAVDCNARDWSPAFPTIAPPFRGCGPAAALKLSLLQAFRSLGHLHSTRSLNASPKPTPGAPTHIESVTPS